MQRTNLIKRREELNLTLQQVADMLDVSKTTIWRFERGETDLSSETYVRYLHVLKLDYSARIDALEREIERHDIKIEAIKHSINRIDNLIDKLLQS